MTDRTDMSATGTKASAVILGAAQLLDEKRYSDTLRSLRTLERKDLRGLTPSEISTYYLFTSICYREMGEYCKSLATIKAALRLIRPTNDHGLFAREKQILGNVLTRVGRFEDAIESYLEAFASFKRASQHDRIYGALVNIGLCHLTRGELSLAHRHFLDAETYAKRFNSESSVDLCRRNRARCEYLMGRMVSAVQLLDLCGTEGRRLDLERAHVRLIWSQVNAATLQNTAARSGFRKALTLFEKVAAKRDVAVCLEYLGLNEYFAGNYAKAREYYDQVLAMPEPTASAVAQTLRMLTDVEIAQKNWEAAKTTAARAETAINKISERIELGALWRANGHIHMHYGNHAEARSCFAKSIDLLRQLGARYELALSHFDAGRSVCHSAEERLEHLRQAKALFLEMEVPKRLAQVDKALTALETQEPSAPDSKRRSLTIKSAATNQIPEIIAVSHAMTGIMKTVDRIKDRDLTVLITGETGTGKDLIAEYIHYSSVRAGKPYRVVNSAALPESLLEAELFGYTRGAFSGAAKDSEGLIASAEGGTFCFDEIGEIPLAVQAKLLRVIDTKVVRPVGGSVDRKVDVRFVALTNRNLEQMVADNAFRNDLYRRLDQMPIHLPPLRARREDILPLIESLLAKLDLSINGEATSAGSQLREVLNGYSWPGNVREMIAIVTRIAALRDNNGHSDIVQLLLRELDNETPEATDRQRLFLALQRHNGNKSKVAEEIGIPRTTLISQLRKLKL